mmetsp:Transcript_20536/g.43685  ORF Transcript_20536/g.43685 Transcript_20536/m.43685 type:complete len:212 (-) Transcript_20536:786-1421(-)
MNGGSGVSAAVRRSKSRGNASSTGCKSTCTLASTLATVSRVASATSVRCRRQCSRLPETFSSLDAKRSASAKTAIDPAAGPVTTLAGSALECASLREASASSVRLATCSERAWVRTSLSRSRSSKETKMRSRRCVARCEASADSARRASASLKGANGASVVATWRSCTALKSTATFSLRGEAARLAAKSWRRSASLPSNVASTPCPSSATA